MPPDRSIRLWQDGQVMLWLPAKVTVTVAPQWGQLNKRACSALAEVSRRPVICSACNATGWPSDTLGGWLL